MTDKWIKYINMYKQWNTTKLEEKEKMLYFALAWENIEDAMLMK